MCYVVQYSTVLEHLGIIYTQTHFACTHYHKWPRFFKFVIIHSKRIFPVNIITNNLQMGNKLLHVLFPYKVSKITQD